MPMRFDDTQIPGLFGTDGFVGLNNYSQIEAAKLILQRLGLNNGEQEQAVIAKIRSDRLPTVKGESAKDSPQKHIAKAARLIEETGYNRRLPELVELQNRIAE